MPFARTLGAERCQLKERPDCRKFILRERIIPDIVRSDGQYFWDGRSARDARSGERRMMFTRAMPDGTPRELRRLARSGQWGDLSGTVLDWFKYSRLREMLDQKRDGVSGGISLWEPRRRGATRRTLKRKR
jgi:hypothetical protein